MTEATGDFTAKNSADLVVGKIYGIRAFSTRGARNPRSTLESMFHFYEWKKGENVARHTGEDFLSDIANHKVAQGNCTCGFYAYYSKTADVIGYQHAVCYGVIEAYGRVAVGNIGFRAEKTKIVALIPNNFVDNGQRKIPDYIIRTAKMNFWLGTFIGISLFLILLGISLVIDYKIFHSLLKDSLWWLALSVPFNCVVPYLGGKKIGKTIAQFHIAKRKLESAPSIAKYAEKYGVPIINTFEEAIEKYKIGEHPPTH